MSETDYPEMVNRLEDLASALETEQFADVKPWMIALLIRVAITNDLRSALDGSR